jgi:hypothetical protein
VGELFSNTSNGGWRYFGSTCHEAQASTNVRWSRVV